MTPEQSKAGRALVGMSQQDLADAAEVAKATIANFEVGKRTPYKRTLDTLQKALEARGVRFTPDGVSK
ncbi:helix-turn-helix transcriptional regulator [Gemmobacter serpentinus]|uniref:helix-turn-helix transcriptional regulator n=1 Tax=Gemmobacter serpentinus TaxID=2652247 RepID=UPI00124BFD46|nr:helix-turn-helix transcriptional regulator [Gemmobacter serpentinus]